MAVTVVVCTAVRPLVAAVVLAALGLWQLVETFVDETLQRDERLQDRAHDVP